MRRSRPKGEGWVALSWKRLESALALATTAGLIVGTGTGACSGRDCSTANCQAGVDVNWSTEDHPDTYRIRLCIDGECDDPVPPTTNPGEPDDGGRTAFIISGEVDVNVRLEFLDPAGTVATSLEGPATLDEGSCCLRDTLRAEGGRLAPD